MCFGSDAFNTYANPRHSRKVRPSSLDALLSRYSMYSIPHSDGGSHLCSTLPRLARAGHSAQMTELKVFGRSSPAPLRARFTRDESDPEEQ